MQSLAASSAFDAASRAVVAYLGGVVPLGMWMVTRYDGEHQVYLSLAGDGYPLRPGDSIEWSQTWCQYSVTGRAPRIAPDIAAVDLYRESPRGKDGSVAAYVGVPIRRADGGLFGTLCGFDARPQPDSLTEHAGLLTLLTGLLGHILDADLERSTAIRDGELALSLAETDALTGVLNRRGWDRMLAVHETRARTFGDPCALIAVDLDGLKAVNDTQGHTAGDALIRAAADVLRSVVREDDVVARLGGDEFGVIATLPAFAAAGLVHRLKEAFAKAGVSAAIGLAQVATDTDIDAAWRSADTRMYAAKNRSRTSRRFADQTSRTPAG